MLTGRPDRTTPHRRLRCRFAGNSRVMNPGSFTELPQAAARQSAKELRAKITLLRRVRRMFDCAIKRHLVRFRAVTR